MTQIKLRRDTAANWATANSVLAQGEPAIDTTTNGLKLGDGNTAWTDLKYVAGGKLSPNIDIEGTVIGLPPIWRYVEPPLLQYSSNGSFKDLGNHYFLGQRFDNDMADFSGVTSISFQNIGGMTDYFQIYKKYEDSLTTIDLGDIFYIDGWFNIGNFSNTLVTMNANNLTETTGNFEISGMHTENGIELSFPALKKTNNLYVDWNWNSMLNTPSPSFPALETVNSIYIDYNQYVSWANFPNLTSVGWEIYFYNNDLSEPVQYAAPGFPALITVPGYIQYYQNQHMTSIPEFTSLTTVGNNISIHNNGVLESFPSFPVLEHVYHFEGYGNGNMTHFDGTFLPSIKQISGDVNFSDCALDEASIDAILAKLVYLDGNNGTTLWTNHAYLNGGTNAIPSAQGLADMATLEGRGCIVYVNS